jgi:hypothetical protein
MSSRFALLLVVAVPFVLVACGGSVERVPDANGSGANANGASSSSSSSSGGGGSGGDRVCTLAPACNAGDRSFASPDAACIEIAGVSCYERSACGATIWCQHTDTDQCAAVPSCKTGWVEVKGCVPDSECEKVTVCGASIICQRKDCVGPAPLCDSGDTQVSSQSECLQDDAKCYSRSNGCGYTIWCTGPM